MKCWKFKGYLDLNTMDRKINFLLVFSAGIVAAILLIATSLSAIRNITWQSSRLIKENIENSATNIDFVMNSYETTVKSLEINSAVQKYLIKDKEGEFSMNSTASARAIANTMNISADVWGITLIREGDGFFINSSSKPSSASNDIFLTLMLQNYKQSVSLKRGSMTYNIQRVAGADYSTFNIYRPVYDDLKLGNRIGLLCIRIDTSDLQKTYKTQGSDISFNLVGTNGIVYIPDDNQSFLSKMPEAEKITGDYGEFTANGKMIIFQKIKERNLYLVGEMPLRSFHIDTYRVVGLLVLVTIVMLLLMTLVSGKIVRRLCRPLEVLRDGMNKVSSGDLKVHLQDNNYGEDMKELTSGFNYMTERIEVQMKEIIEKEREARKNEIGALQESIKPHFLYNTLECIHWQVVSDGNQKASRMVQALARYYRISLSKGKELISLSVELEHVMNYVIIQNMRFNDTINMTIEIPDDLKAISIPKITLQPLIENAIYHGIHAEMESQGWIRLEGKRNEKDAILSITDSGHEMSLEKIARINMQLKENDTNLGYGIRNVHRRIQLIFGEEYGLEYELTDQGGVRVNVKLPSSSMEEEGTECTGC